MSVGVANFYYSQELPPRSVAIAKVRAKPTVPADLVDIDSSPYRVGSLTVTYYPFAEQQFVASGLGVATPVSGATQYTLENQFFEITNVLDFEAKPLFYCHKLPVTVNIVTLTDLDGNAMTGHRVVNNRIYHDFDGRPVWVKYYDRDLLKQELLQYAPALRKASVIGPETYTFTIGGLLTVFSYDTYFIRFTDPNGYRVLPPYAVPLNDPWYARIRFGLRPLPQEYARQSFMPAAPYMLATWVPGTILAPNLIEFERKNMFFDGRHYPDVLVYDENYKIKYALDGAPIESPSDKGFVFPWRRNQFLGIDPFKSRVQLGVELEPTDKCFGFYSYQEPDVVFRDIDVNPYTNPDVKNRVIEFYFADRSSILPSRE